MLHTTTLPAKLLATTESFEIRAFQNSDQQFVIAKCARKPNDASRSCLEHQFTALRYLHEQAPAFATNSVPFPISLDLNAGILLMSKVPGTELSAILRRHGNALSGIWNRERFASIGKAIGTWLRTFHEITACGPQIHVHADYARKLEGEIVRARRLRAPESLLQRTRERAVELSQSCAGQLVPTSASHGDFLPQNILLDNLRVGVVDFSTQSPRTPIYQDLASFLVYLRLLVHKRKYSRTSLRALDDGFLAGYARELNQELLWANMLGAALRITTEGEARMVQGRSDSRVSAQEHLLSTLLAEA